MPVDPQHAIEVAARTAAAYREAELQLIALIRDRIAAGLDDTVAQSRLTSVRSLRKAAEAVMARLNDAGPDLLAEVGQAYRNGRGGATLEAQGLVGDAARAARLDVPQVGPVDSLANALIHDVGERQHNVLRNVEDIYRQVQAAAVARSVAGGITRREASQAAWQAFVDEGVMSFTDRRGRVWRLSSYVEMAVRTVTQRAAVQGQTDRLLSLGIGLVVVSDEAGECPLCRPWEGKVLRLLPGPVGEVQLPSVVADEQVTVHIAGTLEEARLAGLQHPNCGHTIRAYQPGATKLPTRPTADPKHNLDKERQRAIERAIRHYKEREVGALTPEAKATAHTKVERWQEVMRAHLAANPRLKRLPYREQIGAGNLPPGGKAPSPAGRLPGPSPKPPTRSAPEPVRARDRPGRVAAREQFAAVQKAAGLAELLADLDEQTSRGATEDALRQQIRDAVRAETVELKTADRLRSALQAGPDELQVSLRGVAGQHDLQPIGRAGDIVDFDPDLHQTLPDVEPYDPGATVQIRRQGFTFLYGDKLITLDRAIVAQVKAPKSTRAPGKDIEDKTRAEFRDLLDRARNAPKIGNPYLTELTRRQPGWDTPARVVTPADLDSAIESGWTESWRGVEQWDRSGPTAAEIAEETRTGTWHIGNGIYGSGVYLSIRRTTGEVYRGKELTGAFDSRSEDWGPAPLYEWLGPTSGGEPGGLMRTAVDPKAKLADYHALQEEHRKWLNGQFRTIPPHDGSEADLWYQRANDIAWYAVMRGYDGIRVRSAPGINDGTEYPDGVGHVSEADQIIIFNRSVMMIEEASDRYDT